MKELPKCYVIKRDPSNPLWEKFLEWFKKESTFSFPNGMPKHCIYFGKDGSVGYKGFNALDCISSFKNSPTLITLEQWDEAVNGFVLPEKWCVKRTPENYKVINDWGNSINCNNILDREGYVSYQGSYNRLVIYPEITFAQFKKHVLKENDMYDPREDINKFTNCKMSKEDLLEEAKRRYPVGTKFKSAHNKSERTVRYDGNYYLGGLSNLPSVLVMISEKDMGEHLYFEGEWAEIISTPKTEPMKDRTITAEQAQSIIRIAKSSCDWKKRLAKLWGEEIALESQQIKITEELYKEMRGACNSEQHTLFDSIFGKDKKEFKTNDLKAGEWLEAEDKHYFRTPSTIICLEDSISYNKALSISGKKVKITNIEFEEDND